MRQRIGTLMKWAIAQGWGQDNPAENIGRALPKVSKAPVHRRALPYAEVAACLKAIRASRAGPSTKLALEFLVLTAARSGEVRGASRGEIDMAAKVWEVPAERIRQSAPIACRCRPAPLPFSKLPKRLTMDPGCSSQERNKVVRYRI